MKNPYLRFVLITSLVLAILFTCSMVLESYSVLWTSYSFNSTTLSSGVVAVQANPTSNSFMVLAKLVEPITAFPIMIGYTLGGGLLLGIATEFIGPFMVFIFWFIILFLITYFYSRLFKKAENIVDTKSHKTLIICCILSLVLLTAIQLYATYDVSKRVDTMINPGVSNSTPGNVISVSPQPAKVGDTINLTVSGFDNSMYTSVDLLKDNVTYGKYGLTQGRLWRNLIPQNNVISFVLQAQNCPLYAGTDCDTSLVSTVPGNYRLRIENINQSAEINFTIN